MVGTLRKVVAIAVPRSGVLVGVAIEIFSSRFMLAGIFALLCVAMFWVCDMFFNATTENHHASPKNLWVCCKVSTSVHNGYVCSRHHRF